MSLQGKILGFSAESGSGAIVGPNGQRYNFSAVDWNGNDAPVPGAAVDFEATDDGRASGVYPLNPTAAAKAVPAATQAAPDIGKVVALAGQRPALIAAVIALLICAFASFVDVTAPPDAEDLRLPGEVTILEVSDLMEAAERALTAQATAYANDVEQQASILENIEDVEAQNAQIIRDHVERYRQMRNAYGPRYGYERTPEAYATELTADVTEQADAQRALPRLAQAEAQARLNRLNEEKPFINLGFLLYLIPLLAIVVIVLEMTKRASRVASVILALSIALGVGVIFFVKQRLGALLGDLGGESHLGDLIADARNGRTVSAEELEQAFASATATSTGTFMPDAEAALLGEAILSPALGAWLLIAVAAGLIAVTFGLVKVKSSSVS